MKNLLLILACSALLSCCKKEAATPQTKKRVPILKESTMKTATVDSFNVVMCTIDEAITIFEDPENHVPHPEFGIGFYMIKETSSTGKCGAYALNVDMFGMPFGLTLQDNTVYPVTFDDDICNTFADCDACGY